MTSNKLLDYSLKKIIEDQKFNNIMKIIII